MSTSTLPLRPLAGFAQFLRVAASATVRAAGLARAFRHRNDMQILARLDDRMLADIGLTRGDVRDAAAEPLWRDPTAILVRRSRERRRAWRHLPVGQNWLDAPPIAPAETPPDMADWSRRQFPARSRYY